MRVPYTNQSVIPPLLTIPSPCREWREKQAAEIKARDEASQARRQEAISKAERSIDQFYEDYNAKKERNIKENKYVNTRTDLLVD